MKKWLLVSLALLLLAACTKEECVEPQVEQCEVKRRWVGYMLTTYDKCWCADPGQ